MKSACIRTVSYTHLDVYKRQTTAIMTDLHEIGVVGGLEAIEAVLKEAEETDLKLYFIVPSHVPFAPNLETSGGHFNPEIIKKALQRKDAVGLSEVVGPYAVSYTHLDVYKRQVCLCRLIFRGQ